MKNVKTIIIIVLVAGLAAAAYFLSEKKTESKLADEALSDFAIKDTASIDKLVITDTDGNEGVSLVRSNGEWEMESGTCIQQHLVHTILETIKYIKVKSPVSEGAVENINKKIVAHHKKLDIYQNGKLAKTWYVGDPTQDQYGTFMLLKDPEKGKSPEPFIMHLPNMYGNLSTRFITNPLELLCTEVFAYDPTNIASVDVTIPDSSHLNFKIVALEDNLFELYNNEEKVTDFDTSQVRDYLLNFKKMHFENHNYTLSEEKVDSVKQSSPQFAIDLTTKDGETNNVKLFKRRYTYEKRGLDGELLEFDQDRIWVQLNDGTLVVGQYYVFGRIMRDIHFFEGPLF